MSQQGLETIESTRQKTHEWIARVAETEHMEKRDAWKALRAVLQTVRDRLPLDVAIHFGAQLPMLIRGMYYEDWEFSKAPIKMALSVIASYIGAGEMDKVKHSFPRDMQNLFPRL